MQKIDVRKCLCGAQPNGPTYYSPSDGYQRGDGYFQLVCPSCGANVKSNDAIDCCIEWNHLMRKDKANRSKWINLDKKTPAFYEDVIFYRPDTPNCHYIVGMLLKSKEGVLFIQDSNTGNCRQLCYYSHWMPLPDAPKGE